MALKSLNSEGGFGLSTSNVVIDSNGNITAANLTVTGTVLSNLTTTGNISASGNITANGSLTANSGYIYLSTGVIAVASSTGGIFNVGISNINLGLAAADITMGNTSGNVTVRGAFTSNNLTTANTATITNLKVNDFYSNRTPISVSTDTVIDSFPVARYRSAKYTMRVNSDDGYQAAEVLLVHNGINSYVTVYGSLSTIGTDIVTFSTDILSGNVRLMSTTTSGNTTVNLLGTYVAD